MATESFLSSSWYRVAPLRPKLRNHAQVRRHSYRGQPWYVIHDLASGRVHRLSSPAYMLVAAWDGEHTVDQSWSEAATRLSDAAPSQDETIQLLAQLHAADLLETRGVPPDMSETLERYEKQRNMRIRRVLLNPLAIKLPLWDPDRFLETWLWLVRPLFGRLGAALWLAVVGPALILATGHWTDLTANIGDRATLLAPGNLVMIAVLYVGIKLLHELGHAFATKHFGGEVHELGVMILVLFPMPYVDASAAAAFKSKWRRMTVGAAGMLVELFVAALALYVWLAVEPGIIRAATFNVMLVAGVSTILFNGNPLLRYDGYYILLDLVEIPNLAQRSSQCWTHWAERYLFGRKPKPFAAMPGERRWLFAYAPLSFAYRLVVLIGISLFLASQYMAIGFLLAAWGVGTSIVLPIFKAAAFIFTSPRLHKQRGRAILASGALVSAIAILLLVVPIPLHTSSEGVVWLPDSAYVRAGTDSFIERVLLQPGTSVREGDSLIQSNEPSLSAHVQTLDWRVKELEAQLASERFSDRSKAQVTETALGQARTELARELDRSGRLLVRSKTEGTFILARPPEDLPGRFFHEGEVIGFVTPPTSRIVRAAVPQEDIDLVRGSLTGVAVKLTDFVSGTYAATVVREVPGAQGELPSKALGAAGGGKLAIDPRDPQGTKALQRIFQFDLELPPDAPAGNFGSRVFVRFEHDWEPLGLQFYRRVRQLLLSRVQT